MRYLAAFAYSHTDVPHSTVQLLKDHGGQSGIANEICREVDRAQSRCPICEPVAEEHSWLCELESVARMFSKSLKLRVGFVRGQFVDLP